MKTDEAVGSEKRNQGPKGQVPEHAASRAIDIEVVVRGEGVPLSPK